MIWFELTNFLDWLVYGFLVLLLSIYSKRHWGHETVDDLEVFEMVRENLVDFWEDLMHINKEILYWSKVNKALVSDQKLKSNSFERSFSLSSCLNLPLSLSTSSLYPTICYLRMPISDPRTHESAS